MMLARCKVTIPLALGEKVGLVILLLSGAALFFNPHFALLGFLFFLLLCGCAPVLHRVSFFLPIISRAPKNTQAVGLTFDDGPSPVSTPIVLELLARYKLSATFFLIGKKAARHPELVRQILEQGHTIGNHSWEHDNFLMLRSSKRIAADIHRTQQKLKELGGEPVFYRPPAGITGPRLGKALQGENLHAVTFSCRAYDRGNRNIFNLAEKITRKLKPGDIILLHDIPPFDESLLPRWQEELEQLLATLEERYEVIPLNQLILQDVAG